MGTFDKFFLQSHISTRVSDMYGCILKASILPCNHMAEQLLQDHLSLVQRSLMSPLVLSKASHTSKPNLGRNMTFIYI